MQIENDLNSYLSFLMEKYMISVVGYALIDQYKIMASHTMGKKNDFQITKESIFQGCSFSKSLTAYGVLLLKDRYLIDINDLISKKISTWKGAASLGDQVTICDCLSMTSGIAYASSGVSISSYTQDQAIPTLQEILNGQSPAHNPPIELKDIPGEKYAYSGAGYMVVQQVIEDVTKRPFKEFMQNDVLIPLKMLNSTFECPLSTSLINNAIPGFDSEGSMNPDGWFNIVSLASGGVWTNSVDMANFIIAISKAYVGLDNSLLSQASAQLMLTKQKNSIFGLGLVIDDNENVQAMNFRKNGHNSGYHNELIMFPNIGKGIVIMTNSKNGILLINDFVDFVAKKLSWPSYYENFDELTVSVNFIQKPSILKNGY